MGYPIVFLFQFFFAIDRADAVMSRRYDMLRPLRNYFPTREFGRIEYVQKQQGLPCHFYLVKLGTVLKTTISSSLMN